MIKLEKIGRIIGWIFCVWIILGCLLTMTQSVTGSVFNKGNFFVPLVMIIIFSYIIKKYLLKKTTVDSSQIQTDKKDIIGLIFTIFFGGIFLLSGLVGFFFPLYPNQSSESNFMTALMATLLGAFIFWRRFKKPTY